MAAFINILIENRPYRARFSTQDEVSSIPTKIFQETGKPLTEQTTVEARLQIGPCKPFVTSFRVYNNLLDAVIGMNDAKKVGLKINFSKGVAEVRRNPCKIDLAYGPENPLKIVPIGQQGERQTGRKPTKANQPSAEKKKNQNDILKVDNRSSVDGGNKRSGNIKSAKIDVSKKDTSAKTDQRKRGHATSSDHLEISQQRKKPNKGDQNSIQCFPTPPQEDEDSHDFLTSGSQGSQSSLWDREPDVHLLYD